MKKIIVCLVFILHGLAHAQTTTVNYKKLDDSELKVLTDKNDAEAQFETIKRIPYAEIEKNNALINALITKIVNGNDEYIKYLVAQYFNNGNYGSEFSVKDLKKIRQTAADKILAMADAMNMKAIRFAINTMQCTNGSKGYDTKNKAIAEACIKYVTMAANAGDQENQFRMMYLNINSKYGLFDCGGGRDYIYDHYSPNKAQAAYWFDKIIEKPITFHLAYLEDSSRNNKSNNFDITYNIGLACLDLIERHKSDADFKTIQKNWLQMAANFFTIAKKYDYKYDASSALGEIMNSAIAPQLDFIMEELISPSEFSYVYKGSMLNGKKSGKAIIILKDGTELKGEWADDKIINGGGVESYRDGERYKGYFKYGVRNGKGTYYYCDKVICGKTFTGNWTNGNIGDGYGVFTWSDGSIYEGNCANGTRNGLGTFTNQMNTIYKGNFANGGFDGEGTMTFKNGKKFVGTWKAGAPLTGTGTYTIDGYDFFEGKYVNGKREGPGTYTWFEGEVVKGNWVNGESSEFTAKNNEVYAKRKALKEENDKITADRLRYYNECPKCHGDGYIWEKYTVGGGTYTTGGETMKSQSASSSGIIQGSNGSKYIENTTTYGTYKNPTYTFTVQGQQKTRKATCPVCGGTGKKK